MHKIGMYMFIKLQTCPCIVGLLGLTRCVFLERRYIYRGFIPITIKFHVRASLGGRKTRYRALLNTMTWETVATQKLRTVQVKSRGSSESNRRRVDRISFDRWSIIFARRSSVSRYPSAGQYLLGYLRHILVSRAEDRIEVRRRDELRISRRPMRLLRISPPTKLRTVLRFTMCLR